MGRDPPPNARSAVRATTLTAFVDTNVLIRHLTGDPPAQARRSTAALIAGEPLLLPHLVVAECVYVLETIYGLQPAQIAESMRAALALPTIETVDPATLLRAFEIYELYGLDFADAYLVAQAEITGVGEVLSFDRDIDQIESVTRREP